MFKATVTLKNILSYHVDGVTFHKNKTQILTGDKGRAIVSKIQGVRGFSINVNEDVPEPSAEAIATTNVVRKKATSLNLED